MQTEYLYGIIIVFILLVILFVYNMIKGASAAKTITYKTCAATVQVLYTPATSSTNGTLLMTISSTTYLKPISSIFKITYSASNPSVSNLANINSTIINIEFDPDSTPKYLNFWPETSDNNIKYIYIANLESCANFSISDSKKRIFI